MLLAAAGLLDGYRATTHWEFAGCFADRFPKVIPAEGHPRFVIDRNRLTGAGVSSGIDAALMLVKLLVGTEVAENVQRQIQYYPDPPVSSTLPSTAPECPLPRRRA
jgi:cyclohexyl-isocyanide hydratase